MNVTFTRTGERRYSVSVEGAGVVKSIMDPAPGYDALLPHDMAHFVVENELGLMGVFGQLAAGGNANTFRPIDAPKNSRAKRRSTRISAESRKDAELSERVIFVAQRTWMGGPFDDVPDYGDVSNVAIERICREFDRVSAEWSSLKVGGSMTLVWTAKTQKGSRK
ncbi:MAG TPA: hypothetical protein VNA17_03125 [Pyrinomonadaceae bacterium]|nr:hypothetical protein [Pyrinomonadaceae bacterium]